MRLIALLFLLVLPAVTQAGEFESPSAAEEILLSGLHFGQPPGAGMICTNCSAAEGGEEMPRRSILASYKQPLAPTLLGSLEIAPPVYDFYEDQLLRVRIMVLCRNESCADAVWEEMQRQFGMTGGEKKVKEISSLTMIEARNGRTASDHAVEIFQQQWSGRWDYPVVKIYDPVLMEKVRLAANPAYAPASSPLLAGSQSR